MINTNFKAGLFLSGFIISIFFCNSLCAQFGGGTGVEEDPYRIYTKVHFEELADSVLNGNSFIGEHFMLMNNIDDSVTTPVGANFFSFNGFFHGQGYNMTLAIDLRESPIDYGSYSLFPNLGAGGSIDSLSFTGYIYAVSGIVGQNFGVVSYLTNNMVLPYSNEDFLQFLQLPDNLLNACSGICYNNIGTIQNCSNFCNIQGLDVAGICYYNDGLIENCSNNGEIIIHNEHYMYCGGGITFINLESGVIRNCKNNSDILFISNDPTLETGGISANNYGIIDQCINSGNINGKVSNLGGLVGVSWTGKITNSANYGNISGFEAVAAIGIIGELAIVENCFNSGTITGESFVGTITGITGINDTIRHCINIGITNGSALIDSLGSIEDQQSVAINNFYDKQMCLSKGIGDADVIGSAEGKLTTQLTGTSPELHAMLGDGWSYAEGRYPIPLGLENDSMALVAATPVYLHFETEEDYNHVDSVSRNFTVGLENNVTWDEANGRVNFNGENVTLLNLGLENLTVSLSNYSKKVRINIVDIETSTAQQSIENGISAYPNPTDDYINLILNGTKADKVEVYDITGKLLIVQTLSTDHQTLNIETLESGVYFIRVWDASKYVGKLSFVKR